MQWRLGWRSHSTLFKTLAIRKKSSRSYFCRLLPKIPNWDWSRELWRWILCHRDRGQIGQEDRWDQFTAFGVMFPRLVAPFSFASIPSLVSCYKMFCTVRYIFSCSCTTTISRVFLQKEFMGSCTWLCRNVNCNSLKRTTPIMTFFKKST